MRSPGLRPRHWATILKQLPKPVGPKGLDVVFPDRFSKNGQTLELIGGKKVDLALLEDSADEEESWDMIDREELEAMKHITSSVNVKSVDDIDIDQYPYFIIRGLKEKGKVDTLLKLLLPLSKIVFEKQNAEAENARAVSELRDKQEKLRNSRKQGSIYEAQRSAY